MDSAMTFGANLAHERRRQRHTLRSLAGASGVDGGAISRLEHAKRDPRLSTIVKLARALDVPLADLLNASTERSGEGGKRYW